ncbi:MAG TPA: hypothetical protein VJR58_26340, partial [Vineibacter sp.]|nr:hypothetical protein [Vineibacter sp.]
MATYDLSRSEVGDLVQGTGLFSDPEWNRILEAIDSTGVFAPGSTSGDKANLEALQFGDAPGANREILFYQGMPDGPVTDADDANVVIFATNENVEASIGGGSKVVVSAGGDDQI